MDTQVLIVGAGPTGLMLANCLARRGIRCLIMDRHSGPAQQTRAMGVQARTLEIYAQLGIADAAVGLGKIASGANMWANGRHTARIPVGEAGRDLTRFPYVLMLGQDDNEHLLGDLLHRSGVEVQWDTELLALDQQQTRVDATLRGPDGATFSVRADWVAGCDGSRSRVREACNIGFPGEPYEQTFFVADTVATGPMRPDELNVYLWQDGFHLFFPMRARNGWRVIGILPPELRSRDDARFEEVVPHIKAAVGAGLDFETCHWFSAYRISHRRAERFRQGRCFVLGDAAHVHSPMGAQGMNTGLQDAYNLAWKLAAVVRGGAQDTLLDTYAAEREPVAELLLHTTDRAFNFIVSRSWWAGLLRTKVVARIAAFGMRFERIRRVAFESVAQLGIRYRESPLSITLPDLPVNAPRGGDRFPWLQLSFAPGEPASDLFDRLDDLRHHLLLIGQDLPSHVIARMPPEVSIHRIAGVDGDNAARLRAVGIAGPSHFFVRPDGHVGLCGGRFDASAAERYLAHVGVSFTRFGEPVASARTEGAAR